MKISRTFYITFFVYYAVFLCKSYFIRVSCPSPLFLLSVLSVMSPYMSLVVCLFFYLYTSLFIGRYFMDSLSASIYIERKVRIQMDLYSGYSGRIRLQPLIKNRIRILIRPFSKYGPKIYLQQYSLPSSLLDVANALIYQYIYRANGMIIIN